jgi:hypothetical protein
VRIYPLPRNGWSYQLGRPTLPSGIDYTGAPALCRPLREEPSDNDSKANPGGAAWPAERPRRRTLTAAERRAARHIEAKVQTGDRRGITLL